MTATNDDPAKAIIALAIDYDRAASKPAKEAALKKLAGLVTKTREENTPDGDAMKDALIERDGMECQGCGFQPPNKRHLELDHKVPRTDGGSDIIDNRILLCAPCNRRKSNRFTLSGLLIENRKEGLMVNDPGARRPRKSQPGDSKADAGANGEGGSLDKQSRADTNNLWDAEGLNDQQRIALVVKRHSVELTSAAVIEVANISNKANWGDPYIGELVSRARRIKAHDPKLLDRVIAGEVSLSYAYENYARAIGNETGPDVDANEPWEAEGLSDQQKIALVIKHRGSELSTADVIQTANLSNDAGWGDRYPRELATYARRVLLHDPKLLDRVIAGEVSLSYAYENYVRPGGPRKAGPGA